MIKVIRAGTEEGISYIEGFKSRAEEKSGDVLKKVDEILSDIKKYGDEKLLEYTNIFDSAEVNKENIRVTGEEIQSAYDKVDKEFVEALMTARDNIEDFHRRQRQNSWMTTKEDSVILGQVIRGLRSVGIYVPGGTASYPSSVLMNAIPAKVAGVQKIVMVTPPLKDGSINPNILVATDIAGVDEIFKVGGAQAIGALAFGTESIPKVDKIVGPGNIYVAMAKKAVYGYVDIDMIAGPSEILIIADESANPRYVAADLMSQAEHDTLASSVLVTTSMELAQRVKNELERQVQTLSRRDIILSSLSNYGVIIVVDNIKQAVDMANSIAPEHLEILTVEPFSLLGEIKNAGSIFLGQYSPEPLGDYLAGPNHVLPTSGTARFFSPLSVDDFIKKSSFISYSKEALGKVNDKIIKLAETEGLTAHANSIKVRAD